MSRVEKSIEMSSYLQGVKVIDCDVAIRTDGVSHGTIVFLELAASDNKYILNAGNGRTIVNLP